MPRRASCDAIGDGARLGTVVGTGIGATVSSRDIGPDDQTSLKPRFAWTEFSSEQDHASELSASADQLQGDQADPVDWIAENRRLKEENDALRKYVDQISASMPSSPMPPKLLRRRASELLFEAQRSSGREQRQFPEQGTATGSVRETDNSSVSESTPGAGLLSASLGDSADASDSTTGGDSANPFKRSQSEVAKSPEQTVLLKMQLHR